MILFSTRKTFNIVSWLFRKYMKKSYSHCALMFEYFGTPVVVEAELLGGVRITTLENFLKVSDVIASYQVEDARMREGIKYCVSKLGDSYSLGAIFGIAFKKWWMGDDNDERFTCSELIARALGLTHINIDQIDVAELEKLIVEQRLNDVQ
jgi:Permuted papain-like amidase enzyme, YaeF/YiiX, C92 family